jgi:hypothetical protein
VIAVVVVRRTICLCSGRGIAAAVETRALHARTFFAGPVITGPVIAGPVIAGPVIARGTILARRALLGAPLRSRFAVLPHRTVFAILALAILAVPILAVPILVAALRTIIARTVVTLRTILTRSIFALGAIIAILARRLFLAILLWGPRIELALDLIAVLVELLLRLGIVLPRAVGIRFLIARAAFGEHAEIMVGELEIIFGEDPIARLLRVARQRLVFFEQLRGIATRAIVDAIAQFRASVLRALAILAAPAATATGLLTIVDQADAVLNKGGVQIPFCPISRCRIRTAGRSAASPNLSVIAEERRMWG